MEIQTKSQARENQPPLNSPNNNIAKNGAVAHIHSPKTNTTRSETYPCPTTFVQADTSNFKHVVQMLTGSTPSSSDTHARHATSISKTTNHHHQYVIPPMKTTPRKQQGFRLYERRNQLKNTLMINTLMQPGGFCTTKNLSPSMLDFPKLALSSPVTPLSEDPFDKNSPLLGGSSSSEEEKAIAEKGFYLHPSPRSVASRDSEPRLLPLFPVQSPKLSESSS